MADKSKKKKVAGNTNIKTEVSSKPSTQQWLPIADIRNNLVYRKDNVVISGVRVQPVNVNLLSFKEKLRKVKQLEEVMSGIDYSHQIISIFKPVDLDSYIMGLEATRNETDSMIRKRLLNIYIKQATAKATSGEAMERHFYILIDQPLGQKPQNDELLVLQRATELAGHLSSAELISTVCNDSELRTLNFIFTNPVQAAYERSPQGNTYFPPALFAEEVYS